MAQLSDLTPLQNHDLTLGGIVTGVREGYTKTGKPLAWQKWKTIPVRPNLHFLAMNG